MLRLVIFLAQVLFFISSLWATKMQELPSQAFWIKNHWPTTQDLSPPSHWRASNELAPLQKEGGNTTGLEQLHISGSASPSLNSLQWIKERVGQHRPIYLIDLRQETHLYVNGLPISIFLKRDEINWGKSPSQIHAEEQAWISQLARLNSMIINKLSKPIKGFKTAIEPSSLRIKEVYSEAQAAQRAQLSYLRIEVPDYHPPSPEQVDRFLHFLQQRPKNAWLHFHCAGGKGRTTSFMVMTDIIAQGKHLSLNEIIKRQALLGGSNLLSDSPSLSAQAWKADYHQARQEFIQLFYRYRQEAYPQHSFTEWFQQQKQGHYFKLLQTKAYCVP